MIICKFIWAVRILTYYMCIEYYACVRIGSRNVRITDLLTVKKVKRLLKSFTLIKSSGQKFLHIPFRHYFKVSQAKKSLALQLHAAPIESRAHYKKKCSHFIL